jgi:peroxiredoxin
MVKYFTMIIKTTVSVCVSFVFLVTLSCREKEPVLPEVGNKAPSFTLKDIDGNSVSLSDFPDRVVILDFWATWCHACKESSQELDRLYRKYKERGVIILGISIDRGDDAIEKVRFFAERYKLSYPMLMDEQEVNKKYQVTHIPTTFILDKNHVIRKIFIGSIPELRDKISDQVEKLLPEGKI